MLQIYTVKIFRYDTNTIIVRIFRVFVLLTVPCHELLPQRPQREVSSRQEQQGHLGHALQNSSSSLMLCITPLILGGSSSWSGGEAAGAGDGAEGGKDSVPRNGEDGVDNV
jgi:hypothetical protein